MKNKLSDLNDHLFAQLERLSEESLTGDKLSEEITRAKAITDVAKNIVENGRLILGAAVAQKEWSLHGKELFPMLSASGENDALYRRNGKVSQ